jgi:uncharacterized protein YllA (UPF0747 family)
VLFPVWIEYLLATDHTEAISELVARFVQRSAASSDVLARIIHERPGRQAGECSLSV